MKIFDCFMYFDEDLLLDLRLHYLDKFVDKFVIVECSYNHKGEINTDEVNAEAIKIIKLLGYCDKRASKDLSLYKNNIKKVEDAKELIKIGFNYSISGPIFFYCRKFK